MDPRFGSTLRRPSPRRDNQYGSSTTNPTQNQAPTIRPGFNSAPQIQPFTPNQNQIGTRVASRPVQNGYQQNPQSTQSQFSPNNQLAPISQYRAPLVEPLGQTNRVANVGANNQPGLNQPFNTTLSNPAKSPRLTQPNMAPPNTIRPTSARANSLPTKPLPAASPQIPTTKPVPADEPKMGDNFYPQLDHPADHGTYEVPFSPIDFADDPFPYVPFDPWGEADVYQGKKLNPNQRPLIELGKPFYQLGQLPISKTFLGRTNLIHPRFQVFGDMRTALGFNGTDGDFTGVWGTVLNLEMDLRVTATERFHARVAPLDRAGDVTRLEFDYQNTEFFNNTDFEFDTGFFEGDFGALFGGMFNEVIPFDLPFTVGAIPLLFQNGITLDDAFIGFAATPLMARNSPLLDISNFDVVFFWGIDNITSPAFQGDDNAAKMYGFQFFLEMLNGYIETHYAFLEDRNSALDRSYHNTGIAYTRRYGRFISNSVRVIANAGQDAGPQGKTADGVLLLLENSLITKYPSRVIPYFNLFSGFGRPQSIARAGGTGGILRNTGITFETDGVTGLPTLDATANDTWGGALGINILAPEFTQQIVLEASFLDVFGDDPNRNASGREIGFGVRYQLPISNAVIFRADAMHGIRENDTDLTGFRVELRHKF